jgi:hypothetical protein
MLILAISHVMPYSGRGIHMTFCNVPDSASLGNLANLICLLSDLIHWGFLDAF